MTDTKKFVIHRRTPKGTITFTPNEPDFHGGYIPPPHITRARHAFYRQTMQTADKGVEACVIWTGRMNKSTPFFDFNSIEIPARRFVYLLEHGPLHRDDRVRSLCRNPRCVSMFHVEHIPSRQPVPTTLRTSLDWRERQVARSLLRKKLKPETVAKRFRVAPSVLDPIIAELEDFERPKPVRGTKRLRIIKLYDQGWTPERIVSEVFINLASVMTVLNEHDMAKRLKK